MPRPAEAPYELASVEPQPDAEDAAVAGAVNELTNGFQAVATGGASVSRAPEASKFKPSERIW